YQMRIRIKNPNYGREKDVAWKSLADDKEIKSDWVMVKDTSDPNKSEFEQAKVTIGSEAYIYAVDQALLDPKGFTGPRSGPQYKEQQTVVQIHRWTDLVRPNPTDAKVAYPVGDWLIAERLIINRGEYLTRQDLVEVPVWLMLDEKFGLMQYKKEKKVPATFNMDSGQGDLLLVDFQGGDQVYRKLVKETEDAQGNKQPVYDPVRDKSPTELMFLTPSGKLTVHSSEKDADDSERT